MKDVDEEKLHRLFFAMTEYFHGDARRIQHFTKVYEYAGLIGAAEGLSPEERFTLGAAAIVHDIGIRNSEKKYGSCTGVQQEKEGPPEAEKLLESLDFEKSVILRASYMVAHHHTYHDIDGADLQILIEADFLVNMFEDNLSESSVRAAYEKIFATESGKMLCRNMFGI